MNQNSSQSKEQILATWSYLVGHITGTGHQWLKEPGKASSDLQVESMPNTHYACLLCFIPNLLHHRPPQARHLLHYWLSKTLRNLRASAEQQNLFSVQLGADVRAYQTWHLSCHTTSLRALGIAYASAGEVSNQYNSSGFSEVLQMLDVTQKALWVSKSLGDDLGSDLCFSFNWPCLRLALMMLATYLFDAAWTSKLQSILQLLLERLCRINCYLSSRKFAWVPT